MLNNIVVGLVVGFILTHFGLDIEVMNFIQPYVTFEVTTIVYYVICAAVACILLKN